MKIQETMTSNVRIANPSQSIRDAARIMAEIDVGILPVGDNDRLIGMIQAPGGHRLAWRHRSVR